MESYEAYSQLADLPPLVRKQRTLEAKILPLTAFVEQEKAVRADIDALLIKAKIASNDGVTCNGYDVVHHERGGQSKLNVEALSAMLVSAGLAKPVVQKILAEATEYGDDAHWATVKPSKGSKVRR